MFSLNAMEAMHQRRNHKPASQLVERSCSVNSDHRFFAEEGEECPMDGCSGLLMDETGNKSFLPHSAE